MSNHATNKPIMIAHALGAINENTYTNSEAAFRKSFSDGFEYLEADLALTNDQQIVLYHHKQPKTESEKCWRGKKAFQLSWLELSRKKYADKYPILKLEEFLSLLDEFSSTKIILDIKTRNKKKVIIAKQPDEISYLNAFSLKRHKNKDKNFLKNPLFRFLSWSDSNRVYPHQKIIEELITHCDNNLLNRLIPQVDKYSSIVIGRLYDFPIKIWKPSQDAIEQEFLYASQNRCKYISLKVTCVSDIEIQLSKQHDIKILAYGINKRNIIEMLYKQGVSGFYVDSFHQI